MQARNKDSTVVQLETEFKKQIAYAQNTTDGMRKVWTFEIENQDLVPCEFLMLDTQKVREAVREGKRKIPGIRIYQKTQTVYR